MSSPSFLLANETNHTLLQSLLESMNAIIEHQYSGRSMRRSIIHQNAEISIKGNKNFVQALIKSKKRFEALRSFTLESGQQEIERLNRQRKDAADNLDPVGSPLRQSRNGSIDSTQSPLSARSPSLSNLPEEDGTFAIGDDDSDNDEAQELLPTPSHSSPSGHNSRTPSGSSSTDEPLPTQLRGMSEKARGKMPAGQPSFSRQNGTTNLSNHSTPTIPSTSTFEPSAQWVRQKSP